MTHKIKITRYKDGEWQKEETFELNDEQYKRVKEFHNSVKKRKDELMDKIRERVNKKMSDKETEILNKTYSRLFSKNPTKLK